MKIVKKYILVFLGLLLVFFMFSIFVSSGSASGSSYKINLGQYQTGPDFPGYRIAEAFVKKVAELSDGRITINHFAGDLLGDWGNTGNTC
jgi:TRAP-type C4-dicarboxylate transport system substrate-binding protein